MEHGEILSKMSLKDDLKYLKLKINDRLELNHLNSEIVKKLMVA